MKITVLCVGKIKEKFYRDAVAEYQKRLRIYCNLEILEVNDEKTPDKAVSKAKSGALSFEEDLVRKKEGERILSKIKADAYVCTLEINGKRFTSEGFAHMIAQKAVSGTSHIVFVIGGSLGLHDSVSRRADLVVSFSDFTFPHQLMRVILCEQVYRAFRINQGAPYHK